VRTSPSSQVSTIFATFFVASTLDGVASLSERIIEMGVAHQDALSLFVARDLNPDAVPFGDMLVLARLFVVKRLGRDCSPAIAFDDSAFVSNVDTGGVGLGIAWLKGRESIAVVVVEVEVLCGVNVVNADVVLLYPSRVRTLHTTEVHEGVIVDVILGALVIEVDLLFAVELTVALMLKLWG